MNTYFKVVLEGVVLGAAQKYLYHSEFVDGERSSSERGKRKDKEEHQDRFDDARKRLIELLELNFPEFSGRFRHVFYYSTKEHAFVAVNRAVPQETDNETFNPFSE